MTLAEIRASEKEMLTCKDIAEVVGRDQYSIHLQAEREPAKLGFPVMITGKHVTIPRRAFLRYMDGDAMIECVKVRIAQIYSAEVNKWFSALDGARKEN